MPKVVAIPGSFEYSDVRDGIRLVKELPTGFQQGFHPWWRQCESFNTDIIFKFKGYRSMERVDDR